LLHTSDGVWRSLNIIARLIINPWYIVHHHHHPQHQHRALLFLWLKTQPHHHHQQQQQQQRMSSVQIINWMIPTEAESRGMKLSD